MTRRRSRLVGVFAGLAAILAVTFGSTSPASAAYPTTNFYQTSLHTSRIPHSTGTAAGLITWYSRSAGISYNDYVSTLSANYGVQVICVSVITYAWTGYNHTGTGVAGQSIRDCGSTQNGVFAHSYTIDGSAFSGGLKSVLVTVKAWYQCSIGFCIDPGTESSYFYNR